MLEKNKQLYMKLLYDSGLPQELIETYFQDGYLEQVIVNKNNNHWTFCICKTSLVPLQAYQSLIYQVKKKYAHIADTSFLFKYEQEVSSDKLVLEYWPLFLEWAKQHIASVNGWLLHAQVEVNEGQLTVGLHDKTGKQLAERKQINEQIKSFYKQYFDREIAVFLTVVEAKEEHFDELKEKIVLEEREAIAALMAAPPPEEEENEQSSPAASDEPPVRLAIGYDIRDEIIPLKDIRDEEKKVAIQGSVFNLERKELRNGSTLFEFLVTDYTDSMKLKMFAKTKEDVKVLSLLKNGKWVRARGRVEYDRFMQEPELVMMINDLHEVSAPPKRMDQAKEKRVEFHLHTTMSTMDAVTHISDYVATAARWGHKAIAVTDHSNIQCYPDAVKAAKKHDMKLLYGVEANLVNDGVPIVINALDKPLETSTYIVFDIETTGLSVINNKIIEIAAVRMQDGKEINRYSTFVDPHEKIPYNIQQLTNITDDMVAGAPTIETVMPQFIAFIKDDILVAHNARFDIGFIQANCKSLGLAEVKNPVLDTLELARLLHPTMKNHRLNTLADKYKVALDSHHRAIDDTLALGGILTGLIKDALERNIVNLNQLNDYVGLDLSNSRPFHASIYALNQVGKKNLFKLISLSHTQFFKKMATIPKTELQKYREGLLVISGCEKGEFFETVLNKSRDEAEEVAQFYDVLEIQPLDFYMHLVEKGLVGSKAELEDALRRVYQIGIKLNKPVIATGNVHYLNPEDKIYRDITIHGITGFSPLKNMNKPNAHYRTTDEMLEAFKFLGDDIAYEVVVKNTNELADRFEEYPMFPTGLFAPNIEGADDEIRNTCYETARSMYGESLPQVVIDRLEKELVPIIKYNFSANYLISAKLVKKSNEDGYLVGSRGSVGSSIVATFLGISEVNPLPAHYLCLNASCKHSEWFLDGSVPSGFDLPPKPCPECGQPMKGEGQDIPFETFLGFKGDKVPDIDLNFSGEYQPHAHNFTKIMFGEKSVFRAGTIGTVAEKTAYGFAKKYEEHTAVKWRGAELSRLANGCTGVKRSTGQHPGGIVVVPDYIEVEDITPVQYPADDTTAEWKTTHFDYHAFDENLLKLDILGHDDPTMMRMLQDLTGVDPTTIPMNDPKVMSLFNSTHELGVSAAQIRSSVATYGVPEMGTKFVRQMLQETQPSSFADLLQISGLSHGTGVWLGNAQELIKNGTCNIKTVIGCRDDIMLYLIYKAGMDASLAFKITESVRKGKGLTDEWIEEMKRCNVPQWYIDSCLRIEYMFPKAHAAAYVISAVRTAYFKLYYPIEFYATYFTVRADDFDLEVLCQGYDAINKKIDEIESKGFNATPKEKSMLSQLEMSLEMTARGFTFKPIDLYRSDATKFIVDDTSLIPPFSAVAGIGDNAARNIAASRAEGDYLSIEDFQLRSKASKTIIELLTNMGCFRGLPETNQLSLF